MLLWQNLPQLGNQAPLLHQGPSQRHHCREASFLQAPWEPHDHGINSNPRDHTGSLKRTIDHDPRGATTDRRDSIIITTTSSTVPPETPVTPATPEIPVTPATPETSVGFPTRATNVPNKRVPKRCYKCIIILFVLLFRFVLPLTSLLNSFFPFVFSRPVHLHCTISSPY